mgnify:CR=1 FL=1
MILQMRCPVCRKKTVQRKLEGVESKLVRMGSYRRKSDSRRIQRYYCKSCGKTCSAATFDVCRNQNKRRINHELKWLLGSCVSMRRAAMMLGVSRTTIARKLVFLGEQSRLEQQHYLEVLDKEAIQHVQFDELQTIEHTKCKPLSVAVAVSECNRKILGVSVSCMPATGHLAKIARKKYGKRRDERRKGLRRLFEQLQGIAVKKATFLSDEHPYYRQIVARYFPQSSYVQVLGAKGAVTGQGELKKIGRDPLFYINHTLAMLRANINRLVRKTWCTTKKAERLLDHLSIYMSIHNKLLTPTF